MRRQQRRSGRRALASMSLDRLQQQPGHQLAAERARASRPSCRRAQRSSRAAASSARVRTPPMGRPRSSLRRSPPRSRAARAGPAPPSSASTFPSTTPLMPPADVPAMTSTVTDSRGRPGPARAAPRSRRTRSRSSSNGLALGEVLDRVEPAGRPDQLVQLLGHPVHVDGERDAAVADQRQPELDAAPGPGGRLADGLGNWPAQLGLAMAGHLSGDALRREPACRPWRAPGRRSVLAPFAGGQGVRARRRPPSGAVP